MDEDEYRFRWSDAYWSARDNGMSCAAATAVADIVMEDA